MKSGISQRRKPKGALKMWKYGQSNNQRTANYYNNGMPFYLYQTMKENVNIHLFKRTGKK